MIKSHLHSTSKNTIQQYEMPGTSLSKQKHTTVTQELLVASWLTHSEFGWCTEVSSTSYN